MVSTVSNRTIFLGQTAAYYLLCGARDVHGRGVDSVSKVSIAAGIDTYRHGRNFKVSTGKDGEKLPHRRHVAYLDSIDTIDTGFTGFSAAYEPSLHIEAEKM